MNHNTKLTPEQQAALDWYLVYQENQDTEEEIEQLFRENEAQYKEDLKEFEQKYPEIFR